MMMKSGDLRAHYLIPDRREISQPSGIRSTACVNQVSPYIANLLNAGKPATSRSTYSLPRSPSEKAISRGRVGGTSRAQAQRQVLCVFPDLVAGVGEGQATSRVQRNLARGGAR